MRLPRDLSGRDLVQALKAFGYDISRQTGSHVRLTTQQGGREHHITIPAHNHLRVGTLGAILSDVAEHFEMSREQLVQQLFEE
jgi:predicted RNA binding protein YcfA (HicA-like mRNA interferase family)